MKSISDTYCLIVIMILISLSGCSGQYHANSKKNNDPLIWELSALKKNLPDGFFLLGDPKVVRSPMGKAIHFNGQNEAFFYDRNPLKGLKQFTIEVIMEPDSNGPFAQRFLHLGSPHGRRVLMEIRNEGDKWYLDAYLNSVTHLTLVDSAKTHPTGKWYDVAFVVDNGKMDTYVNGEHELSGKVKFSPFKSGEASLGVRLNQAYWFKGSIYMVRIVPKALKPQNFLKIKQKKKWK